MSPHSNGGYAFPMPGGPVDPSGAPSNYPEYGMTLRDWFAGQALAGIAEHYSPERAEYAASAAYAIADAMLAERQKGGAS